MFKEGAVAAVANCIVRGGLRRVYRLLQLFGIVLRQVVLFCVEFVLNGLFIYGPNNNVIHIYYQVDKEKCNTIHDFRLISDFDRNSKTIKYRRQHNNKIPLLFEAYVISEEKNLLFLLVVKL